MLKYIKRLATAAALVFGLHWLMAPTVDFDPNREYKPNNLQREFIRAVAKSHYYLGFGDTDHSKLEIHSFVLHKDTIGALVAAGKKDLVLENGEKLQPILDRAKSGSLSLDECMEELSGDWACSTEAKADMCRNFLESASGNSHVRFVAGDQRMLKNQPSSDMISGLSKSQKIITLFFIGIPVIVYDRVYGCLDTKAFIPSVIPALIDYAFSGENLNEKLINKLIDDRPTAEFILSMNRPAAVLYGAGHFQAAVKENNGQSLSMRDIFAQRGRSIAVLDVFRDSEQEQIRLVDDARPPDARLFVIPSPENLDGIEIVNPDFQKYYDEAKRKITVNPSPPTA